MHGVSQRESYQVACKASPAVVTEFPSLTLKGTVLMKPGDFIPRDRFHRNILQHFTDGIEERVKKVLSACKEITRIRMLISDYSLGTGVKFAQKMLYYSTNRI